MRIEDIFRQSVAIVYLCYLFYILFLGIVRFFCKFHLKYFEWIWKILSTWNVVLVSNVTHGPLKFETLSIIQRLVFCYSSATHAQLLFCALYPPKWRTCELDERGDNVYCLSSQCRYWKLIIKSRFNIKILLTDLADLMYGFLHLGLYNDPILLEV